MGSDTNYSLVGLKQFRSDGCLSYLYFDRQSGQSALIDPVVDLMESYRDFIVDHELKLANILDTHTHADHFSASHLMAKEYGCAIGMSHHTRSQRLSQPLRQNDRIRIGRFELIVLETPGHTPDSLCFHSPEGLVFTGDTLLIGASGRTDFPGADPARQWDSIHRVLGGLPESTVVLPGHDYNNYVFSTIDVEKRTNPHWLIPSLDAFVAMKNAESITTDPEEIRHRIDYNVAADPGSEGQRAHAGAATACGTAIENGERVGTISIEKYRNKLEERADGNLFVDVREPEEYLAGHMPGSRNIPLSELGLHLKELSGAKRVYLSCQSGRRSMMGAKSLSHVGVADAVNVTGGFAAWAQSGQPIEK